METRSEGKKPIQVFREKRGLELKKAQERHRETLKVKKQITGALGDAAMTAPELAKATGLPADLVFWHLMAMKKYGEIEEGEEREGYFAYSLKKEEKR